MGVAHSRAAGLALHPKKPGCAQPLEPCGLWLDGRYSVGACGAAHPNLGQPALLFVGNPLWLYNQAADSLLIWPLIWLL